jgi:microcystin degradation protein MlrC
MAALHAGRLPRRSCSASSFHGHQHPVGAAQVTDGAGSAGDSTFILAEAQRLGDRGLLQTVRDPEAVQTCVAAGGGSTVTPQKAARYLSEPSLRAQFHRPRFRGLLNYAPPQ